MLIFVFAECQTDVDGDNVAKLEQEISVLKAALLKGPECDVTMISGNDKLTRY